MIFFKKDVAYFKNSLYLCTKLINNNKIRGLNNEDNFSSRRQ